MKKTQVEIAAAKMLRKLAALPGPGYTVRTAGGYVDEGPDPDLVQSKAEAPLHRARMKREQRKARNRAQRVTPSGKK